MGRGCPIKLQTDIDWDNCERFTISADRDDLPGHIRAIKVPTLDAQALRQAVDLIGGDVNCVQIDAADVSKGILGFPHAYILEHGRFSIESEPFGPTGLNHGMSIRRLINHEFTERASKLADPEQQRLMQEWKNCLTKMPDAVDQVFPRAYKGFWVRGDGRFDQREEPSFHRHGGYPHILDDHSILPGYFLNFTPSHDGTVFPDEQGNLWYAPGGSYVLFASDGHDHVDGCDHEVPDQYLSPIEDERRATAVMQIYPFPEM